MEIKDLKDLITDQAKKIVAGLSKETEVNVFTVKCHFLKLESRFFNLKKNGMKDWELRINDRHFKALDLVCYLELIKADHITNEHLTGNILVGIITYVHSDEVYKEITGFPASHVIYSDKVSLNIMDILTLTTKKKER
jgi:hypothetical protein